MRKTTKHMTGLSGIAVAASLLVTIPAAAQGPADSGDDMPGDIVVTATKRSESASKVPISITAYSQEGLDQRGIRDIRDVANQTPGLDISRASTGGSGQTRISIRGIDSTAGAATSAVYIDDTPIMARNSSLNYNGTTLPFLFDLERVEVLRGPQGTLFGASSQGGAVRFVTPTPSLSEFNIYGRAAINTVKHGGTGYEGGLAVGVPIVDGSLGTNSIEQARAFHKSFGLTGLVVTKLDGTSRGGAIVGIWRELKLPIFFLGLGEQAEDLQPYSVENYVKAVFGLE